MVPTVRNFTNDSYGRENSTEEDRVEDDTEEERGERNRKKTNLSDDLHSSKIGPRTKNNNSSTEYAIGALAFQDSAIRSGILDMNGANPTNDDHIEGVGVEMWNS